MCHSAECGLAVAVEVDLELEDVMSHRNANSLEKASSAYLRSAMHQPVSWREWGDEAFRRAQVEDKPILLDIGAVWCHWCHVMDRESYEDAATAKVINDHFIAIKVDRDERPDVDTRYQAAVASISGQGGWPLTAFLTPDGRPFFGGTYFPPEDRHGRPSLKRVLLTMAEAFQNRRSEVNDSAGSVMAAIEHNETFSGRSGNPGPDLVAKLVDSALKQYDKRSGGFGSQPKFPHSSALDLLIDAASRVSVDSRTEMIEEARVASTMTLEKMARGGIYDHLAGGFHRYSVDERWIVPHFEKMAYDNSELLKNYIHAFQTFVDPEFARVAREIIGWMNEWLSDQASGGFYASQDADVSLDDDGDYFTWTRDEAAEVLTPEELAVAAAYFEIGEVGNMHHNPAKNVLHITGSLERIAHSAKVSIAEAKEIIRVAKRKMYAARLLRPAPFIDRTMYVGWNAMCISAYLEAGRVLEAPEVCAFALKSLDRLLQGAWSRTSGLTHVLAYGDSSNLPKSIPGILDDYVFLAHACLDAWEATGEIRYYADARDLADSVMMRFYDLEGKAFYDTEKTAEGAQRIGALAATRKPLQDSPTPAGNPVAAALLLRLEALSGNEEYVVAAQETMETFAGVVEHFGLYAATYGLALQRMLQRPVQVCIIGDDANARILETIALARYAVNKSVVRLRRDQLSDLPPVLAQTLPALTQLKNDRGGTLAIVCSHNTCQPPVSTADALLAAMNRSL